MDWNSVLLTVATAVVVMEPLARRFLGSKAPPATAAVLSAIGQGGSDPKRWATALRAAADVLDPPPARTESAR